MPEAAVDGLSARRVAIIGLGLIGGSVARGLRAAGFAGKLSGAVANEADQRRVIALDLVDECHLLASSAVAGADLVVVAVPPPAIAGLLRQIAPHLSAGAVVTDTTSSKVGVMAQAKAAFDPATLARFVPGHPIAGTERSGVDAGFARLFSGRRAILTPDKTTDAKAVAMVEALWRILGAEPVIMSAVHHDEVLAATSHLPHVLAYTLVDTLAGMAERQEIFAYAAGGFADFTRIASSDPGLWCDIVSANRAPVLAALDEFMDHLGRVREAIAAGDDGHLAEVFTRARIARDGFAPGRKSNN